MGKSEVRYHSPYGQAWQPNDWKPGPYPKTEAERIAAAKKYNMLPEDYKPYPDDGWGYGDYPMIEAISMEARDPFECYDDPHNARNYGEVMHIAIDQYDYTKINMQFRDKISMPQKFAVFFTMWLGGLAILAYFKYHDDKDLPLKPIQFPYNHDGE